MVWNIHAGFNITIYQKKTYVLKILEARQLDTLMTALKSFSEHELSSTAKQLTNHLYEEIEKNRNLLNSVESDVENITEKRKNLLEKFLNSLDQKDRKNFSDIYSTLKKL